MLNAFGLERTKRAEPQLELSRKDGNGRQLELKMKKGGTNAITSTTTHQQRQQNFNNNNNS